MIFKGSRYETIGVTQVTDADGKLVSALGIRIIAPTAAGYQYTVRAGDRLDLLASQFYCNPEKFWLISDANDAIDEDDLLEPGRPLLIPPDRTS